MGQLEPAIGDEQIVVQLTRREWNLVIEHAFMVPEVQEMILGAPVEDGMVSVPLTPGDVEDFAGWMAAAANHAKRNDVMMELAEISDILEGYYDRYRTWGR